MSSTVISVENLSKSYRLGVIGTGTFRGDIQRWWAKQRGRPDPYLKIGETDHGNREGEIIWALKNVNIQVQQGEALGIIGRNGAGKSTLLKVLSRVTAPTIGVVKARGRIASLLEVGTGFHPELTGRENIYLNGAIMGMSRYEITRKLEEIVDFSGVKQFVDTPVKRYSSGMYVRLAFAVAAHLEPEILIVDEVLAVGDADFQKKCLGKMGDVTHEGRTVLFVSHNLGAISNLCTNAFLLEAGSIIASGKSSDVIAKYQSLAHSDSGCLIFDPIDSESFFTKISIVDKNGNITNDISVVEDFKLRFEYVVKAKMINLDVAFILFDRYGSKVFTCSLSKAKSEYFKEHKPGKFVAEVVIPGMFLAPGMYTISPAIHQLNIKIYDLKNQIIQLKISETGSAEYMYTGTDIGSVLVDFNWHIQELL